ncbi:MAG TPA: hypothetical protein VI485_17395 [Vicinamibacterales bacterium]|nr:hypothetical protein [Vicinamibacterales bacterium]
MSNRKWGESFLKSGLPLEHMIAMKLRAEDWRVSANLEYARAGKEEPKWFEVDLFARSPNKNLDTELSLLVECKYHDSMFFWMFLPTTVNEGRMLERGDAQFLNCCPAHTLKAPQNDRFLKLAPLSSVGVVLSNAGDKQDNAVHTAMQQLSHALVPIIMPRMLSRMDMILSEVPGLGIDNSVVIPMVVTNATLYRLRPDISDLATIRNAAAPEDIADKVNWTWCRNEATSSATASNRAIIASIEKSDWLKAVPWFRLQMRSLISKPSWIAVVNADAFDEVLAEIEAAFTLTPMFWMSEAIERHNRFSAESAARLQKFEEQEEQEKREQRAAGSEEEQGSDEETEPDDIPF